jgi:SAM-dependent methyltransferase
MAYDRIVDRYDARMYHPLTREYYGHSGFQNYGYWRDDTRSQKEASGNLVAELAARLPKISGPVLDVACGMGASTQLLLELLNPPGIVGINISAKQLATARQNVPRGRFVLMDAANLAFADSRFGAVVCVEAAFHFRTREAFLREAYRVLQPGGTLVLSDIMSPRLLWRRGGVPENLVGNLAEYRNVYARAGYRDIDIVDARERCWGGFYRNLTRWGWRKVRSHEVGLGFFLGTVLAWSVVGLLTKSYLLVSARRP